MFTLKKIKLNFIALGVLAIAATYLVSCQDENAVPNAPKQTVDEVKLKTLAFKMTADLNDTQIDAVLKEYSSLSQEELAVYEKFRLEADSVNLVNFIEQNKNEQVGDNLRITAGEIRFELQKIRDIRRKVNDEALRVFGKTFNKLNGEEMNTVFTKFENHSDPDVSSAKTLGCPDQNYMFSATASWGWGKGRYGIWRVESDCDFEYRFDGQYNKIKCRTPNARTLLAAFRNKTGRRLLFYNDGVDTAIILGANRVYAISGSPYAVAIGMAWE